MPSQNPVGNLAAYNNSYSSYNALGDSIIGAQSFYTPVNAPSAFPNIPAWAANTAYVVGNTVSNGGYLYRCTVAGTSASSGGPTTTNNAIADNGVTWAFIFVQAFKQSSSFLTRIEQMYLGRLSWDMSSGYGGLSGGLLKIIVVSGGSNYSGSPTLTLNNGATASLQVVNGSIQSATVLSPGYGQGTAFSYTLSDGTGSGAVLSLVQGGSGTFGVPGCRIADCVARLPDVLACPADIIFVHCGTNDISASAPTLATMGSIVATLFSGLRNCYEQIMAAGKVVVAIPVAPRTGLTGMQIILAHRLNHEIRAYCKQMAYANPNRFRAIVCADPTRYLADGTGSGFSPIGGSGAGNGAMTQDGLHPSARGAYYYAKSCIDAMACFVGSIPNSTARSALMSDGFDLTYHPSGNMLEAFPWQASTPYVIAQTASVGGNVYRCKGAGTSSAATPPSGTGSTITDGGVTWAWVCGSGRSVSASGTAGAMTAATGITFSGNLMTGMFIQRNVGSAGGTVACSIESPYSDGQVGQRQVVTWNLSAGSNTGNEFWVMQFQASGNTAFGIQPSDYNIGQYYCEMECELSGVSNLTQFDVWFADTISAPTFAAKNGGFVTQGTPSHLTDFASSGEMLAPPTKLRYATQPLVMPATFTGVNMIIEAAFDVTVAATATVKLNYLKMGRANAA